MHNRTAMEAAASEVAQIAVDSGVLLQAEFEGRLRECCSLAFRVAFGVLRHREEAEDVAQETLLRVHRNFHRLREPARLGAWVVRVAWRLAIDRQRSARCRDRREPAVGGGSDRLSAEQLAVSNEFERAVYRALDGLPERLRVVVVLAGIEGYGIAEVSRLLQVPEGTVKSRLHTARKKLAEKLRRFVESR